MVLSIGEKSSTPDKSKLPYLHAQSLAFPISPIDKEKIITRLASPLLPPPDFSGGTMERSTPPPPPQNEKN